jgi:ribosomal protein S6--L-glutamate ligase
MGHETYLLHPRRVHAATSNAADARPRELPHVFLPRIGSTIDDGELSAVLHLERAGIPAVNGFRALAVARDKFLSLRELDAAGIPVPGTRLVTHLSQLPAAVRAVGGFPLVMKATRGRQGTAVFLVRHAARARALVENPPGPAPGVVVQEYLPAAARGDGRIVVVGGRAVGSMRRIPRPGEFRANAHLRGTGVPWDPPRRWIDLALGAAEVLGLAVAGVDLMEGPQGPVVLEVNTTPGFRELERAARVDAAGEIIRHAARMACRR